MTFSLPPLVFGATSLGNLFVAQSEASKRVLIAEWFRLGTSPIAIDTAGKYGAGLALEVLGRALAAAQIAPDQVLISNKLGWRRVPLQSPEPTFEPGVWIELEHDAIQDISYDGILRCWREGQQLLGDYPQQLVSVHDPDEYLAAAKDDDDRRRRRQEIVDAYRALIELRDQGLAVAVGMGVKDWRVVKEFVELVELDWVMLANSLTIMHHPPELIALVDALAGRGIAVINSAITHGGFLVGGSYLDYREVDPDDPNDAAALQWRAQFQQICEACNVTPYEVAVAFGRSHPAVTSLALSTSRPNRVAEMIQAARGRPRSQVWQTLQQQRLVDPSYPYLPPV